MRRPSDVFFLYAARAARGFGDGFAAIILPAYLIEIGFNPFQVGLVAAAALLGSAAMTLAIGFLAPRHDLRTLLLICAFLMVLTGIAIPSAQHLVFIAMIAFIGTINPSTGDIGVHVPLEHAALAQRAGDTDRTRVFARYSLVGALSIAAGALAAGLPDLLVAAGIGKVAALQAMFYGYAALGLIGALLYSQLPHSKATDLAPKATALGPSRGTVYKLAALFSLDSFAGGFTVQSLMALWLFERFELSLAAASAFFLLVERARRLLVSGGGAAGATLRPRQHDGVHAHTLEHLPHRGGVLTQSHDRARAAAGALRALADGRADTHVLRDGGGDARRADRRRERYRGPAQPRLLHQPGLERRAADHLVRGLAAGDLRRAQDRLRPGAVVFVPSHQAARGTGAQLSRNDRGGAMDDAVAYYAIFLLATFSAALVAGLSGFAFGLIAAAIWLHILTPLQTATLIVAFGLIVQGVAVWKLRHALDWQRLWPFVLGAALGVPLGVAILRWADPRQVQAGVGVLLVLYATHGSGATRRWRRYGSAAPRSTPASVSSTACWAASPGSPASWW